MRKDLSLRARHRLVGHVPVELPQQGFAVAALLRTTQVWHETNRAQKTMRG